MAGTGGKGTDGRQARWDRHNLVRRRHILDAALDVLEEVGPGVEVKVQEVAVAAGLSRTVVYRHFDDRADLDGAVRERIVEQIRDEVQPVVSLDGTPLDIVKRVITAYVGWAAAHPALHRFAEQEPPDGGGSHMEAAIAQIAQQIEDLFSMAVQVLGVRLDDDDRQSLDPLVFGMVGAVFTAVRRWMGRAVREPAAPAFVERLSEAIFHQIAGLAATRGVVLERDVPLEVLLADAFDGQALDGTPAMSADDEGEQ